MWWNLFLIPLIGLTAIVSIFLIWSHYYWKVRGVPDLPPVSFWKIFYRSFFVSKSQLSGDLDIYKYFSGKKFGGYIEFGLPTLWVMDPDLLRSVFVKDYDYFTGRAYVSFGLKAEYADLMITNLSEQTWKDARNVMSRAFTPVRMKEIFSSVVECGDQMISYLAQRAEKDEETEMTDAYERFTMDITGNIALGIKSDSFKDSDASFAKMATKLLKTGPVRFICIVLMIFYPKIMKFLGIFFPITNFGEINLLASVVKDTITERKKRGTKGRDFLQFLLDAQKEKLQEEEESDKCLGFTREETSVEEQRVPFKAIQSEEFIIAQSIIYFLAGFDTVSNTIGFVTYELALNPDIQEKLFEEVKEALEKHDGHLTYDIIMELKYLDKVIHETLRIHPPTIRLARVCSKNYQIPGTDVTIEKGTIVQIPVFALHHDERYFPNPKKFDPERFSPEERAKRSPYMDLAFGHGPRNCLGMRFALLEVKVVLAMTILNFRFHPSKKTEIPPIYSLTSIVLKAKNGLWIKLEKRQ